jgi:hypothetical protein
VGALEFVFGCEEQQASPNGYNPSGCPFWLNPSESSASLTESVIASLLPSHEEEFGECDYEANLAQSLIPPFPFYPA